jgi:nuclear GTP-binding protein
MPKKSKGSKSKRLSLRQKYKIIKKVKEHHKKKRKELKKSGNAAKAPKDPGIPSQWPFKEELIKELAWKRQQILMDEKKKKDDRKRARDERNAADMDTETDDLESLAKLRAAAANKQADFDTRKKARLTTDFDADKGTTPPGWPHDAAVGHQRRPDPGRLCHRPASCVVFCCPCCCPC